MYKMISYGNRKFEESIRARHLIPYTLGNKDRYIKGQFYYSAFYQKIFKVLFVKYYNSGELEGAEIRHMDGMHAYMCTEIDPGCDFLLIRDENDNIFNCKDIVNNGKRYTGAEIKYWFFTHNIDCFNRKYSGFWQYVDSYSPKRINDKDIYMLMAKYDRFGNYTNCKMCKIMK